MSSIDINGTVFGGDVTVVDCGGGGGVVPRPRLPQDSAERKRTPLCTGVIDYFPAALEALVEYMHSGDARNGDDLLRELAHRNFAAVAFFALEYLTFELTAGADPVDETAIADLSDMVVQYAPAFAAIAQVSWHGNEKHNPGQPLHHARGKSADHADCIARHFVERGGFDGVCRHSASLAWRALAMLQEDLESKGALLARGARL